MKPVFYWEQWRYCRRNGRRQARDAPPNSDFCATTSGSKHGSSHRIGTEAATTREDGAAAAQWTLPGENAGANCRPIVQSKRKKAKGQRVKIIAATYIPGNSANS